MWVLLINNLHNMENTRQSKGMIISTVKETFCVLLLGFLYCFENA